MDWQEDQPMDINAAILLMNKVPRACLQSGTGRTCEWSSQGVGLPSGGESTGREVLGKGGVFSVRIRYSFTGGAPVGWGHKVNAVRVRSLEPSLAVRELGRTGIRRFLREAV
jgi:hypothetical protein